MMSSPTKKSATALVRLLLHGTLPDEITPVLELASRNDLLLATVEAIDSHPRDVKRHLTLELDKKLQKQHSLEASTPALVQSLLDSLPPENASLLTIKSFLPFPYIDSNIDLLAVGHESSQSIRQQIHKIGYRRYRNLADVREPMKEMYCPNADHELTSSPCLHLHTAISWNGITYLDTEQAWRRRRLRDWHRIKIPIPSPEDEILILAAHALFENKFVNLANLLHLYYLSHELPDWEYIAFNAKTYSWGNALTEFFGIAKTLSGQLGIDLLVPKEISEQPFKSQFAMPYVLPISTTLRAGLQKLLLDIRSRRVNNLARSLFTYFLVDLLWMYRKAWQKQ